jgi:predicted house-cleaning NTP pyrophosphatase (Maf/HAM1 superfamily)
LLVKKQKKWTDFLLFMILSLLSQIRSGSIFLISNSPRRKQLLESIGLNCHVLTPLFDEIKARKEYIIATKDSNSCYNINLLKESLSPHDYVLNMARGKLDSVVSTMKASFYER